MIAEAIRRSPLAEYAERFARLYEATGGSLSIREIPFLTQVNLRVDPRDQQAIEGLSEALGFGLPVTPNTVASGKDDRRALWLGPDEWLLVAREGQSGAVEQSIRNGFGGASGSIVDVSASRTLLQIRGAKSRELLAHTIPLDLHLRAFPPGRCAQTLLATTQVIIERCPDDGFHLYLRCSFARYTSAWLIDASAAVTG